MAGSKTQAMAQHGKHAYDREMQRLVGSNLSQREKEDFANEAKRRTRAAHVWRPTQRTIDARNAAAAASARNSPSISPTANNTPANASVVSAPAILQPALSAVAMNPATASSSGSSNANPSAIARPAVITPLARVSRDSASDGAEEREHVASLAEVLCLIALNVPGSDSEDENEFEDGGMGEKKGKGSA